MGMYVTDKVYGFVITAMEARKIVKALYRDDIEKGFASWKELHGDGNVDVEEFIDENIHDIMWDDSATRHGITIKNPYDTNWWFACARDSIVSSSDVEVKTLNVNKTGEWKSLLLELGRDFELGGKPEYYVVKYYE
jgi:hypothetical protein